MLLSRELLLSSHQCCLAVIEFHSQTHCETARMISFALYILHSDLFTLLGQCKSQLGKNASLDMRSCFSLSTYCFTSYVHCFDSANQKISKNREYKMLRIKNYEMHRLWIAGEKKRRDAEKTCFRYFHCGQTISTDWLRGERQLSSFKSALWRVSHTFGPLARCLRASR